MQAQLQTPVKQHEPRERTISVKAIVLTLIALVITIILLFPIYWMIVNSLETNQQIFRIPVSIVPTSITFSAYTSTFADQFPHLITSLLVSLGTVVVSLVIATPAAYALAHFRIRLSGLLIFCLLIAQMVP